MSDCIFCKLANSQIPAEFIYEDELVVAFRDANPVAPVHVLVVPKKHIQDFNGLAEADPDGAIAARLAAVIPQVAEKLGVKETGYRLINNCGAGAGQTVMHLHFHLIAGTELSERLI